jgi:hypothetical protein
MKHEAGLGKLPVLSNESQLVPGLVKSLYDDNNFKSCLRKDNHTLILEGIAGAGKTTTLVMLTRRLKANWQAKLECNPGSLFVNREMADEQVLSNLNAELPSVLVRLKVILPTSLGERVSIVGSIPQLGNWSIQHALRLSPSSYTHQCPLWRVTICVQPGSRFEWKHIIRREDGYTVWQEGPNHECVVPHDLNSGTRRAHNNEPNGREDAGATQFSKHTGLTRSGSMECVARPQNGWRIDSIGEAVAVACVSYDSRNPDQHSPMSVLMSLLLQLIEQIPDAEEIGISLHKRTLNGLSSELKDIGNAIIKILNRTRSGCIIIDALDECDGGSHGVIVRTLSEVKRIQAKTSVGVILSQRLVATGERTIGPWTIFEGASHYILKAGASTTREYVQVRLRDFSYKYSWVNKDIIFGKITDAVSESCGSL